MPFGRVPIDPESQAGRDMFKELARSGYLDPGIGPLTVGGGKKWEVFNPVTGEVLQTVGSEKLAKRVQAMWQERILRSAGRGGAGVIETPIPDYARKGVGWVQEGDDAAGLYKRLGQNLDWMFHGPLVR